LKHAINDAGKFTRRQRGELKELIERHINKEVLRFFEEAMLESVGWIGGYIQIGQNGPEIQ
jgi:hypothetical protein